MAPASEILLIQTTCPDKETARELSARLLDDRLVSCINLIDSIESHYNWKGKREQGTETLLLIKAPASRYPEIERAIEQNHPYELPEIIAVPVSFGLPAYTGWVAASATAEES